MKGKEIKNERQFRIYHNIANFEKQHSISRERENKFGVKIKTTNEYNKLSPEELK